MVDPTVRAAFEAAVQHAQPATCAIHGQRLDRIERALERVERARGPGADLARARQLAAPVDAWEAEPERDPETGELVPEGAGAR